MALSALALLVALMLAPAAVAPLAPASGRTVQPLDEGWQFFRADVTRFDEVTNWSTVTLPHCWNATDAETGSGWYAGIGWYQRNLGTLEEAKGRRVVVRFEAAGSVAEVFVNDTRIGEHRGSYGAFAFDVTDSIALGRPNILRVKVDNRARKDVLPVNDYLFTIFGGLYRHAQLIIQEPVHVTACDHGSSGVALAQSALDAAHGTLDVTAKLQNSGARAADITMRVNVTDAAGVVVASEALQVALPPGTVIPTTIRVDVPKPHRWNGRRDPYLYGVAVEVVSGGTAVDRVAERWGFRTCEVDPAKGFILNGEPYPLRGVCRHQERQGKGNALTAEDEAEDMAFVREIGATSVRFAHYQQSDNIYRLCDELGILAWAEIPFVNAITGEEGTNAHEQLVDLIRQARNHPSIFVWGLHNEVYGKRSTDQAPALTRELHDRARLEDPWRPTVAVTGSGTPVQPTTYIADLQGFNRYIGWYEGSDPLKLEAWIQKIRAERPDDRVSISEYGAEGNVAQQSAAIPEPFPDPVKGQYFPEIVQTRYHESQWSVIERYPSMWGSYVWNLFDFTVPLWNRGGVPGRNQKGLVTYDRATRKDAFHWYRVNWSDEPAVHVADLRIPRSAGTAFDLPVYANRPGVKLMIDGAEVAPLQDGVNRCHRWARGIRLTAGRHRVEATIPAGAGSPAVTETTEIVVKE